MLSEKKLRGVVYNIAQHAMSSMSYIHPHLSEHCRAVRLHRATVDLLNGTLAPCNESVSTPLGLGMTALSEMFSRICESVGVEVSALSEAEATFEFAEDGWPRWCYVRTRTRDGKELEAAVDSVDRKAKIVHERPGRDEPQAAVK